MGTDNNKEVKRILTEINGKAMDDYGQFLQSSERYYVAALADCMTSAEHYELFKDTSLEGYLKKRDELLYKHKPQYPWCFNRPIPEVLADFSDSKNGKRTEARKELQSRFSTQACKDQVRILTAMLQADTKVDTAWVAKTLSGDFYLTLPSIFYHYPSLRNGFWDLLYQRCEKHLTHPDVAVFMVDRMPEEYVNRHLEQLESIVGYRKLCLALAPNPDYVIDESKLTLFQYLDVLAKSRRTPKQQTIWSRLCEWMHNVEAVSWESHSRHRWEGNSDVASLSLTDISEIRWFVKSCGTIRLKGLICAMYVLDQRVKARLQEVNKRDANNLQIPKDPLMADQHYKELLVQFAKEEIDKVDTSSLPKDVTLTEWIFSHTNIPWVVTQLQGKGDFMVKFHNNTALMHIDDFTNTYYFKMTLPTTCSKEAFLAAMDKLMEHGRYRISILGSWADTGAVLRTKAITIQYNENLNVAFKSDWSNLLYACKMLMKELDSNVGSKP